MKRIKVIGKVIMGMIAVILVIWVVHRFRNETSSPGRAYAEQPPEKTSEWITVRKANSWQECQLIVSPAGCVLTISPDDHDDVTLNMLVNDRMFIIIYPITDPRYRAIDVTNEIRTLRVKLDDAQVASVSRVWVTKERK